jgi:hypothetical protein
MTDTRVTHTPCDAAGTACTVATHDHTYLPDDGRAGLPAEQMVCNHCNAPTHYAEEIEEYVHDSAPECPLALDPNDMPPEYAPQRADESDGSLTDTRGCSCGMADYGAPGHDGDPNSD